MTEPYVLHETVDWLVVHKPEGLHTVARKGDDDGPSLEAWLGRTYPELKSLEETGLVHRLDVGTSVMIVVQQCL